MTSYVLRAMDGLVKAKLNQDTVDNIIKSTSGGYREATITDWAPRHSTMIWVSEGYNIINATQDVQLVVWKGDTIVPDS